MLELLFREAEAHVQTNVLGLVAALSRKNAANVSVKKKLDQAIQELNVRLQYHFRFVYNNGFLHLADDQLSAQRIAQPFWDIVADPKWSVVDREMKEAFDRLDHGQQDALTYAIKALESTIKIISGDHGWTTGKERGAANFIEHLSSNGFIAAWEAEAIKLIFSKLRNPHSHGGGHLHRHRSHVPSRPGQSRAACRGSRASCGGCDRQVALARLGDREALEKSQCIWSRDWAAGPLPRATAGDCQWQ